jgi:hypothetical protein
MIQRNFLEGAAVQFLVLANVREDVPNERVTSLVKEEAKVVWGLYASGSLRSAHYRSDIPGAVLMLEAADLSEATKTVESLPMVQAGLLKTEIMPLEPYTGFEALFAR